MKHIVFIVAIILFAFSSSIAQDTTINKRGGRGQGFRMKSGDTTVCKNQCPDSCQKKSNNAKTGKDCENCKGKDRFIDKDGDGINDNRGKGYGFGKRKRMGKMKDVK